MKRALVALFASSLALAASPSAGQVVNERGFCLSISKNICHNLIPEGAEVSLRSLPTIKGQHAVYFWADISSSSRVPVALVFEREGTCASEQISMPEDKFVREEPEFDNLVDHLKEFTLANLWAYLGFGSLQVSAADITVKPTFVEPSSHWNFWDFRNIACTGTMRARIFHSNGEALAGNNNVAISIDVVP